MTAQPCRTRPGRLFSGGGGSQGSGRLLPAEEFRSFGVGGSRGQAIGSLPQVAWWYSLWLLYFGQSDDRAATLYEGMETTMKAQRPEQAGRLEELPNIGKAIAADLRAVGIREPRQLAELEPLAVYMRLAAVMAERHDPCVFYTLLAARHFLDSGEARPWWQFVNEGRRLLRADAES